MDIMTQEVFLVIRGAYGCAHIDTAVAEHNGVWQLIDGQLFRHTYAGPAEFSQAFAVHHIALQQNAVDVGCAPCARVADNGGYSRHSGHGGALRASGRVAKDFTGRLMKMAKDCGD